MRYIITSFFLIILFTLSAQQENHHHRVKILLDGRNLQELAALGIEVDHGSYAPFKHLINDFSDRELALVTGAGFTYEVLIPTVEEHYANPFRTEFSEYNQARGGTICNTSSDNGEDYPYDTPTNFSLGSMAGFFTYQEMLTILDSMRTLYPNLISPRQTISNISTEEGRPIFWLRISDNPDTDESTEPEVLYTALHHAREPNSLSQMIFYMWHLLENYETDPEIQYLVNNTEMYFVPCVNPDGYIHNEAIAPDGGGLWRKNRHANDNGSFGVDLNRNYGFNWGFDNDGSSPNPNSDVYRGTAGFSEAETQAVKYLCEQHEFLVALNYHTHGNLLIYPWGFSDTPTDDSLSFNILANVMTLQNNYLAGTGTETVGYTVNGDSDDWMYGETGTKPAILAMTPEVGGTGGFWPASDQIIPNCKASVWMNMMTANTPHVSAIASGDPNQFDIDSGNPFLNFQVQRFGLTDGSFTVSLSSLQPILVNVAEEPKVFELNKNELQKDSFALSVIDGIAPGTELDFLISIDNGSFTRTDTIRRIFSGFISTAIFSDLGNDVSNWASSTWGVTDEAFVSAPTSITDSPYAPYSNNSVSEITLNDQITIGAAEEYKLRFSSRWNIEAFYDYAQLQVQINGEPWFPVCGRYSVLGSEVQDFNQPVWEGVQEDWVEELVDLTNYVNPGDEIKLRFLMVSDQFLNPDGFYVDDLVLEEQNINISSTYLLEDDFELNIIPNPSHSESLLQFRLPIDINDTGQWQIFNSNGTVAMQGDLDLQHGYAQVNLSTELLAAGIYWVVAKGDQWQVPAQKLVVVR